MRSAGSGQRQIDWVLDEFVRATPGVRHALVISGDGLRMAASREVDPALADGLSAAASGLVSLARGAAGLLRAEPVSQTIVEMAGGYLFLTSISRGSTLVVYAERGCDIGLVGYEMTMLASRVGRALTPANRVPHARPPDEPGSASRAATAERT